MVLVFFSGLFEGLHHGQGLRNGSCGCVPDWPVPVLDWCLQQTSSDCQGSAQAAAHHADRSSGAHPPGSPLRQHRCHSLFSAQAQGTTWLWRRYFVPCWGWHAYGPGAIFSNAQPTPSPLEPSQFHSLAQRGWYKGFQSQKQERKLWKGVENTNWSFCSLTNLPCWFQTGISELLYFWPRAFKK